MRLLLRTTHSGSKRNSRERRQSNALPSQTQPIPDSTASSTPDDDDAVASSNSPQSNVVTIVDGKTLTAHPATSSDTGLPSDTSSDSSSDSDSASSSSTDSSSSSISSSNPSSAPTLSSSNNHSDTTEDSTTSSSSTTDDSSDTSPIPINTDDSSPTPISTSSAPTSSSSSSANTTASPKPKTDRPTTRPDISKTRPSPTSPFTAPTTLPAKQDDKKGGFPLTIWIAIGGGCLGGLLLIMALAAYYRRWRRKRDYDPARESFMNNKPPPPTVPSSPTSAIISTKERPQSPDWSDAPLVPPVPPAFHHMRSSSLPEPGSAPGPEDVAPFRQLSRSSHSASQTSHSSFSGVSRPRQSAAPASIITRGDSRLFSRPPSEVVLEGRGSDTDSNTGSLQYDRRAQNRRHNSYASSKYESLRLNSQRNTMADPELRYM